MKPTEERSPSPARRAVRWIGRAIWGTLLALLLSLLFGFLVGLFLRSRLERPVQYIGAVAPDAEPGISIALLARGSDAPHPSRDV
jgi:hypothetical protein